jgi:hypothetical protein
MLSTKNLAHWKMLAQSPPPQQLPIHQLFSFSGKRIGNSAAS